MIHPRLPLLEQRHLIATSLSVLKSLTGPFARGALALIKFSKAWFPQQPDRVLTPHVQEFNWGVTPHYASGQQDTETVLGTPHSDGV